MTTFRDLLKSYGLEAFASDTGVNINTAKQMRTRDSVPPDYWPAWVSAAEKRGRSEITIDLLARLRAQRREPARSHSRAAT